MKFSLIAVGLVFRAILHSVDPSSTTQGLMVGPAFSNDLILECSFLNHRQHLNIAPANWCSSYIARFFFGILEMFSKGSQENILMILGLLAQLFVASALEHIEKKTSGSNSGLASKLYWLNPLTMLSFHLSPIPHLLHVLIAMVLISVTRFDFVTSCASMLILVSCSLQFFAMIPSFCLLHLPEIPVYKYHFLETVFFVTCIIATVTFSFYSLFDVIRHYFDLIFEVVYNMFYQEVFSVDSRSFSPSMSLLWYLKVQMFIEKSEYFSKLFFSQPFLFGLPLAIRLSESPYESSFIALAIIFFFRSCTSMSDICFIFCLFLCNPQRVTSIRIPFVICSGILVPMVLSPLMLSLWLHNGTANANFFFFQILIMWIFISVLIIEYTRATLDSIRRKYNVH